MPLLHDFFIYFLLNLETAVEIKIPYPTHIEISIFLKARYLFKCLTYISVLHIDGFYSLLDLYPQKKNNKKG